MVTVIYSEEFLKHDNGPSHPERPERLTAIISALKATPWSEKINWQLPTSIAQRNPMQLLHQVHDDNYIERVRTIAEKGGGYLDMDTSVSRCSYNVALLAVNAWLDAVDRVWQTGDPTFIVARPPGHHATPRTGMGFCLFANAAIAAYYALEQANIERVAILDWDVHHGNGTESIVENHPKIAYCSLHQSPCYPGTGRAKDRGKYNNILNIPMNPGSTFPDYQTAFIEQVIPFLQTFSPDILIVSAGYDANKNDPLAEISLQPEDYSKFTEYALQICPKILFGLEGGYDLKSLSESVVATLAPYFNPNS
jgi:acetoin utilization deacetylase AcuC-like enzyme